MLNIGPGNGADVLFKPMKPAFWKLLPLLALVAGGCGTPPTQDDPHAGSAPVVDGPSKPVPPPAKVSEFELMFRDSGLVDIQDFIPGIAIDLRYTTTDNFVGIDLYGDLDKVFMRKEAAEKLKKAQSLLQEERSGYSLLVFDGARPFRVQQLMWDSLHIPNKRNYLAPPSEGSVHNYGCAVDLSIADSLGNELDMGTPYDFFGNEAQPKYEATMLAQGKLTPAQHANRLLLRRTMKKAGFFDIHTEWWHFNAFGNASVKQRFSRLP